MMLGLASRVETRVLFRTNEGLCGRVGIWAIVLPVLWPLRRVMTIRAHPRPNPPTVKALVVSV